MHGIADPSQGGFFEIHLSGSQIRFYRIHLTTRVPCCSQPQLSHLFAYPMAQSVFSWFQPLFFSSPPCPSLLRPCVLFGLSSNELCYGPRTFVYINILNVCKSWFAPNDFHLCEVRPSAIEVISTVRVRARVRVRVRVSSMLLYRHLSAMVSPNQRARPEKRNASCRGHRKLDLQQRLEAFDWSLIYLKLTKQGTS